MLGIILLGLILRVVFINTSPSSLYGDELTIALDSNSLLKTGHDQLGNFLPLTFAMGAGRPAGYVYGSIPFIAIFGPTALGVRMLSILSGVGIIFLMFLLGKKLFSENIGTAAAFLLAVSPWDISLSRGGFEAHLALFLALLGIYFFLKAKEKPVFYLFSALSFGLTLHTYPTHKVTLPLFLILLIWFVGTKKNLAVIKNKYVLCGVIVFLILAITSLSQTFIGGSETRFFNINVFSQSKNNSDIEQKIDFERQITLLPAGLSKYFHNKPLEYGKVLLENYLQNFSMDFLFIHGDRNPRQNMATIGEMYLVDAILILVGLLTFWSGQKRTISFLLLWIILSPIPTAIIDLPHALRSSFMLPPLILLSALGLTSILSTKNKPVIFTVSLIFLIQFTFFLQKLYFLAPAEYSNFWAYPGKLASQIALENKDKYKYVLLSDKIDSIEFAYPLYAKVDPNLIIEQNKKRVNLGKYQFKKFDNIYVGYLPNGETENLINSLDGSVLFIGSGMQSGDLRNFETVYGMDKTLALIMRRK